MNDWYVYILILLFLTIYIVFIFKMKSLILKNDKQIIRVVLTVIGISFLLGIIFLILI